MRRLLLILAVLSTASMLVGLAIEVRDILRQFFKKS
jgi:hypothetical protein